MSKSECFTLVENGSHILHELYMDEKDKEPTKKFLKKLIVSDISTRFSRYSLLLQDINYATDPNDPKDEANNTRCAHYRASITCGFPELFFGKTLVRTHATFPYNWINPKSQENEPGFISITFEAIVDNLKDPRLQLGTTIIHQAFHAYNHMYDIAAPGRNTIVTQNAEATYQITITARALENN